MRIPPFSLERYFARHEFTARHLLGSSDPQSMPLAELLALEPGAAEGLGKLWLGYTESTGDPDLKAAIASRYATLAPAEVLVFVGAQEPIFAFMNVALGPGDHLVAHAPGYQSHFEVARATGAEVSFWSGDADRGWALDPDALKRLLRPNTKAILVNVPHNPTGFLFTQEAWLEVVAIAREAGVWLFSDEVYRGLEQDPEDRLPAACDLYERAVSLDCLSKSMGLPGLRLGWIATHDRALLAELAAFKDYLTICAPAPSEYLAGIAVRHAEQLFARSRRTLARNLEALDGFFQRQEGRFAWHRPRAGSTLFPRLRAGGAERFCEDLVRETGIMVVPSTQFAWGDAHLRFGYGRSDLPGVLDLLEAHLARA